MGEHKFLCWLIFSYSVSLRPCVAVGKDIVDFCTSHALCEVKERIESESDITARCALIGLGKKTTTIWSARHVKSTSSTCVSFLI